VSSTFTGPGYSAILFGLSIAAFFAIVWTFPKPKGRFFAYLQSLEGLTLCWVALALSGAFIDYVFGYKGGFHQGVASSIWVFVCLGWLVAVNQVLNRLHRFLTLERDGSRSIKDD
jgi:hypothetical protein